MLFGRIPFEQHFSYKGASLSKDCTIAQSVCNTIFKLQNTIQYLVSQYGRNYGENLKPSLVQVKLVVSMAADTLELGHWPKPRLGRSAAVQQTYVAASISTGLYLVP